VLIADNNLYLEEEEEERSLFSKLPPNYKHRVKINKKTIKLTIVSQSQICNTNLKNKFPISNIIICSLKWCLSTKKKSLIFLNCTIWALKLFKGALFGRKT
jgi:hypothetical protein